MTSPTIICWRSGRYCFEWPRRPSSSPPRPSKDRLVVSMKTTLSSANRSRRRANSPSSTRSLRQRGVSSLAPARRQLAASGLIGERLAEPSHGAVEMMQLKRLSALDPVVGSPLFRSAVRARHKQPVEHRQEHRALGSKLELPACGELF